MRIHSHRILRNINCIQVASSHLIAWPHLAVELLWHILKHICTNSGAAELLSPHEVRHELHGQREDDGGVPLRRDGVEGLQVAELQGRRRLCDDQRRLFEGTGGVHLALCSNNLQTESTVTLVPFFAVVPRYTFLKIPTFALASRAASASAAMALCIWCGSLTSLISTRSTLMPQWSVASSRLF